MCTVLEFLFTTAGCSFWSDSGLLCAFKWKWGPALPRLWPWLQCSGSPLKWELRVWPPRGEPGLRGCLCAPSLHGEGAILTAHTAALWSHWQKVHWVSGLALGCVLCADWTGRWCVCVCVRVCVRACVCMRHQTHMCFYCIYTYIHTYLCTSSLFPKILLLQVKPFNHALHACNKSRWYDVVSAYTVNDIFIYNALAVTQSWNTYVRKGV